MTTKEKILEILAEESEKSGFLNSEGEKVALSGEKLASACGVSRAAVWKAITALRESGIEIEGTTNGGYRLSGGADIFNLQTVTSAFCRNYSTLPKINSFTEDNFSTFPENSTSLTENPAPLPEKAPSFTENVTSLTENVTSLSENTPGAFAPFPKIAFFPEIDSTNSYAKRLLSDAGSLRNAMGELTEKGKELSNSIYVAESQSAGRGRLGRSFYSPKKNGVYVSVIYAPKCGITNPAKLTAFAAVAVRRAICKCCGLKPKIKWINDLFLGGKKVCGILAEGITNFETGIIEAAVIGVGINISVSEKDLPEDLKKIVGGLENFLSSDESEQTEKSSKNPPKKISRSTLSALVAGEILKIMDEEPKSVLAEYKAASFLLGKEITIHPLAGSDLNTYKAVAIDIDDNASLVVQTADGEKRNLFSGEVSIGSSNIS